MEFDHDMWMIDEGERTYAKNIALALILYYEIQPKSLNFTIIDSGPIKFQMISKLEILDSNFFRPIFASPIIYCHALGLNQSHEGEC